MRVRPEYKKTHSLGDYLSRRRSNEHQNCKVILEERRTNYNWKQFKFKY
jgi:hypothetical protein